jgi:hypothetical protein
MISSTSDPRTRLGLKGSLSFVCNIDSREDWVTLIFGEDGKQIPAPQAQQQPPQEKSVYDLDPEEEDKIAAGSLAEGMGA